MSAVAALAEEIYYLGLGRRLAEPRAKPRDSHSEGSLSPLELLQSGSGLSSGRSTLASIRLSGGPRSPPHRAARGQTQTQDPWLLWAFRDYGYFLSRSLSQIFLGQTYPKKLSLLSKIPCSLRPHVAEIPCSLKSHDQKTELAGRRGSPLHGPTPAPQPIFLPSSDPLWAPPSQVS